MKRPLRLRSHDVAVALQLVLTPDGSYPALAEAVRVSLGESHNAVKRLEAARLVAPATRTIVKRALMDLLLHGVPYVFPGRPGAEAAGVPTAYHGPALATESGFGARPHHGSEAGRPVVWPSPSGRVRGASLAPMCPEAPAFVLSNPLLYRWLTLVDALRISRPRERQGIERILRRELYEGGGPS